MSLAVPSCAAPVVRLSFHSNGGAWNTHLSSDKRKFTAFGATAKRCSDLSFLDTRASVWHGFDISQIYGWSNYMVHRCSLLFYLYKLNHNCCSEKKADFKRKYIWTNLWIILAKSWWINVGQNERSVPSTGCEYDQRQNGVPPSARDVITGAFHFQNLLSGFEKVSNLKTPRKS